MTISAADSITGAFVGKCTTNPVFPQANDGAVEAAGELGSEPTELLGPADCADTTAGIDIVTNAVTQQVDVIMVSNNAGDQLGPAAAAAQEAGHPGRDLGLSDPIGRGRVGVHRTCRPERCRPGDGGDGSQHPR